VNLSAPFVKRPVATTLLTIALALAGINSGLQLPVAILPEFDFPVVIVVAQMVGASPDVMATAVATPLERRLATIADISEISSINSAGRTQIVVTFGLGRDGNGAVRDVQAAVNAARTDMPTTLNGNPSIFKFNPAGLPIAFVSLTSTTLSPERLFDLASSIVQPEISSVEGVGQTVVLGSAPAAIRIELNPDALAKYGVDIESVRAAIAAASANSPKGVVESASRRYQIYANDNATTVQDLQQIVIAYRQNAPIRISDVAEVVHSLEKLRPFAITNGKRSILVRIDRQLGANLIETADRVKARLELVRAALPPSVSVELVSDRAGTIHASLRDLQFSLIMAALLAILVVFAFLDSWRASLIAAATVPIALLGSAIVMRAMGFSVNGLSLMALIVVSWLVVDDSIVVIENISRHLGMGARPLHAALRGAAEVGFPVIAISLSLVAAFIPLLFVGGLIGRVVGEFAVTFSAAVLISLLISLTTSPMLCAYQLSAGRHEGFRRRRGRFGEAMYRVTRSYARSLDVALRHSRLLLATLLSALALSVYLFTAVPKSVFPQQDPGRLRGLLKADDATASAVLQEKLKSVVEIIQADSSVKSVAAYLPDAIDYNEAEVAIDLYPSSRRRETSEQTAERLSAAVSRIAGVRLDAKPPQEFGLSARPDRGDKHQYDLRGDDIGELRTWASRLAEALKNAPEVSDPEVSASAHSINAHAIMDRDLAMRLGVTPFQFDNSLFDAFGQRPVSTFQDRIGEHYVIMEVAAPFRQDIRSLEGLYLSATGGPAHGSALSNSPSGTTWRDEKQGEKSGAGGMDSARNQRLNAIASRTGGAAPTSAAVSTSTTAMIPVSAIARFEIVESSAYVRHLGNAVSISISFGLPAGVSLSEAMSAIERTKAEIHVPASIHAGFSGLALALQDIVVKEIVLIVVGLATIYIILGMLYESFVHPLVILSTLPPAGAGALLSLGFFHFDLTLIAFIGIVLLTGIVMKNAILMIEVAIRMRARDRISPRQAILQACLLRFRPIVMTTIAGVAGSLPLAVGVGNGAELRQPLGVALIGGLVVSQALTLYTTPMVYLLVESWRERNRRKDAVMRSAASGPRR